jgi:predicted P-loop ATPase
MAKLINLPTPVTLDADAHARADSERAKGLFAWADAVLKQIGLTKAVATARSIEELRRVTFNAESAEVILAIRDALHPASGQRAKHFIGLREGGLKQILKNRFAELKKSREGTLRGGRKQPDWTAQLILDNDGRIVGNLANLILILHKSPKWTGVLAFDEFAYRVEAQKPLPLDDVIVSGPWTDHLDSLTRVWFLRNDIKAAAGDVGKAVQAAARYSPFHPVREFFASLTWDRKPRLETWLQTFARVEDSAYARAIGPRYLISAVARIYEPGCKADHVLVLEGPQGKQKSEFLRMLAVRDEWFTDRLSNLASKDAVLEIAGVLLIEIAELAILLGGASSTNKGYLSRRTDRCRLPYGRHVIRLPRQCVFAGTINPPVDGYLTDPTGSRRIWPVACEGTLDLAGLEQVRNQLWAEAVHRYQSGAPWWLETPELEALATAEQAKRFKRDIWYEPVADWIGERLDVGMKEVLHHALGLATTEQQTVPAQKRVAAILTLLGFTKTRPRTPDGERPNRYRRDPPR